MKIAVLGTGMVGEALGSKLIALGHEVTMGSRSKGNDKATAWVNKSGGLARQGTFAEAAAASELVLNCTLGSASLEALTLAGATNLAGKILWDLANPLDFSAGMPPSLFVSNKDSLGEQIQRAFPDVRVVKTLNTINCNLMVDAPSLAGEHTLFVCGNDAAAKATTRELLEAWFGWRDVIDLGDISAARATESYLHLWLRLWGALKTPHFNLHIVRR
jgi:predicted dinucleotide-binding enzyme